MSRPADGFALVETVVAMLLLAVGLFGAAASLIRGQVEVRATLLATRAADLAADLAEQLRTGAPDSSAELRLGQWQRTVGAMLTVGSPSVSAAGQLETVPTATGLPASHAIRLVWWDPALRAPRRLELPVLLAPRDTLP
jgi:type II secretory pathway pseudopilin PulG